MAASPISTTRSERMLVVSHGLCVSAQFGCETTTGAVTGKNGARKAAVRVGSTLHIRGSIVIAIPEDARRNRLVAALPEAEWKRWLSQLEPIDMPLGEVLYESGATLSHVYFPTTAIVSLLYVMENGASAEIAVVGREGLVGISLFMGGESTPSRAVVQSAGKGYRLAANVLKDEFNRAPILHLLLRYTQALITQMAQTAVCNRHHTLDQQLCRWLLLSLDRLEGPNLVMTQELIANMLGVRREGVTEAALKLQGAGLISYARGRITVLDRPALEARTCECYAVVKREYDRLLPDEVAA
jgi:CRP-like cAMP-binding protein